MEMLKVECISSLYVPPESVLQETGSYTHSTSCNLLIEGQMWGIVQQLEPTNNSNSGLGPRER